MQLGSLGMHILTMAYVARQAWSVNRYAMVARKHGLYHTCINIINSMYGFNAMEVQEAFTKIKEQVCTCGFGYLLLTHACTFVSHPDAIGDNQRSVQTHVLAASSSLCHAARSSSSTPQ